MEEEIDFSRRLKRCPFCGGMAVGRAPSDPWIRIASAGCFSCDFHMIAGSVNDVIEKWNRRSMEGRKEVRIPTQADRYISVYVKTSRDAMELANKFGGIIK